MAKSQRDGKKGSQPSRKSTRKRARDDTVDDDGAIGDTHSKGAVDGSAPDENGSAGERSAPELRDRTDELNAPGPTSGLMPPPANILAPMGAGIASGGAGVPLTPRQQQASPRHALAIAFKLNPNPTIAEMEALASFLQLQASTVTDWFERRRQLDVWAREMMAEAAMAATAATAGAQAVGLATTPNVAV
eukprot:CAMPEP_0119409144 /NCGR_PEP_ID=MMETSP1335-20130426/2504_1 /TAXON_ID=259385 /ORGANISM="Chrysoculter rhomboideus, Strain RCC1486" /LENGTH=189 /DNA_ID=CAMNT_0007433475 /DNA_START=88 /DNA_END=657 /DNA_ORIENTATION=-